MIKIKKYRKSKDYVYSVLSLFCYRQKPIETNLICDLIVFNF